MTTNKHANHLRLVNCLHAVDFDRRYATLSQMPWGQGNSDTLRGRALVVVRRIWGYAGTLDTSSRYRGTLIRMTNYGDLVLNILFPLSPVFSDRAPKQAALNFALGDAGGMGSGSLHYLAKDVRRARVGLDMDETFVPAYDDEVQRSFDLVPLPQVYFSGEDELTEWLTFSLLIYNEVYAALVRESMI
jgi:hypothetical protein